MATVRDIPSDVTTVRTSIRVEGIRTQVVTFVSVVPLAFVLWWMVRWLM